MGTLHFWTFVALVTSADGWCFARPSTKRDDGTVVCVTESPKLVMGPGEEVRDLKDCYLCRCSEERVSCCGLGYNAGVIMAPDNFTLVHDDNCEYHFEPVG